MSLLLHNGLYGCLNLNLTWIRCCHFFFRYFMKLMCKYNWRLGQGSCSIHAFFKVEGVFDQIDVGHCTDSIYLQFEQLSCVRNADTSENKIFILLVLWTEMSLVSFFRLDKCWISEIIKICQNDLHVFCQFLGQMIINV